MKSTATRNATPWQRYQYDLEHGGFNEDAAQAAVVRRFDTLFHELIAQPAPRNGLVGRILGRNPQPLKGLYIWGGVGRGKTWLMDCFYECLPFEARMRTHFHRFMQRVHNELAQVQNRQNPLDLVAERLAGDVRLLCFDEFFVSDIGDAMLMAGLLKGLFDHGVTLVATSNIEPDGLYLDGLQRAKFLPAIELLKRHCNVMHLDSDTDYRLRILEQAEIYHSPLDAAADASLEKSFLEIAPGQGRRDTDVEINGRQLTVRMLADGIAWFDFPELCEGPRSSADYIELARDFNTILVSNVPVFDKNKNDPARRFITMIDEFYDHNVKVILSAAAPLDTLYQSGKLSFEFERTQSRLIEMQSHDYLAREHLP